MKDLKSYGINKQTEISSSADLHIEEFKNLGYTIIGNALTNEELIVLKSELHRVYDLQEIEFGKQNLISINEEYMARALLCYSEPYLKLATKKNMLDLVEQILGGYYVLHLQNGVINMPNEEHHQSSWHRDLPYQNWVSSEPMGCNMFYCLDDFNEKTGGTFVLPYSQKIDHSPSKQYIQKSAVQVNAKAGSVIFFDSMIFHKAGYNSSNNIRRGVNNMYVKPIIKQQIDLPKMLNGKYKDDLFLNKFLGYDSAVPESVNSFRSRRQEKNIKSY
ncbi:MAG: hypothetical protein RJA07_62 [Bacteroidota bacterium]|jgi:ectoine hydroxylase-related dioxygenase (phytanoyl-CoA dioxygenase family)